jgi:hypothetical protein
MIGRRNFMMLAGASAFYGASPVKITYANPLIALAITQLASSAGSYIAGELLSSVLGSKGTAPSNSQVIEAIHQSTEEIKKHVSQQVKAAIVEDNLMKLQAGCTATLGMLNNYANALPEDRPSYIFQLEQADTASRIDVEIAKGVGTVGLPVFAALVSLRIMVAKAFFDFNGKEYMFQNFANELQGHIGTLRTGYRAYLQSLHPGNRLIDFQCKTTETGGGMDFPLRMFECSYRLDGVMTKATDGGASPGGKADKLYTYQAIAAKTKKEKELFDFQDKMKIEFAEPLNQIAYKWELVVAKIVPGMPVSVGNPGVVDAVKPLLGGGITPLPGGGIKPLVSPP